MSPFLHDRIVLRPMNTPSRACAIVTTSSCFRSAPRPERPTTSAAYFAAAERPESKSCSCAFSIAGRSPDRLALRASGLGVRVWSEPAMLSVPLERAADALSQTDARRKANFVPRARDVERAALGEKIDPPAIDRRLDPERAADRFAHRPGRAERPHRQVPPRRRDARAFRHQIDQLVQRRHFPAGEDVNPIRGRRMNAAQAKAFYEIVDEGQMVMDFARAERDPPPPRDPAKQPQQPAIAGSERRLFGCRWMLDVTMHPDRTAVHDALRASTRGGFDDVAGGGRIHRAKGLDRQPGLP